jgi:hypothetical protein
LYRVFCSHRVLERSQRLRTLQIQRDLEDCRLPRAEQVGRQNGHLALDDAILDQAARTRRRQVAGETCASTASSWLVSALLA